MSRYNTYDTLCNSLRTSEKCVGIAGNTSPRNIEGALRALIPVVFFFAPPHNIPLVPPREKTVRDWEEEPVEPVSTLNPSFHPETRQITAGSVFRNFQSLGCYFSNQSIAQGPFRDALFFSLNPQPHPGTSLHLTLDHFTSYVPP